MARHLQDALFQFRGRLVGHPRATPRLRRQALIPILLVGFLDLVEVAPADAGALAGQPDIVEFLGQGQKPEPGLDELLSGAHEAVSSFRGDLSIEKPKITPPRAPHPRYPSVRSSPAKFTSGPARHRDYDLPPFSLPVVIWKAGFHSICPAIPPEPPVA